MPKFDAESAADVQQFLDERLDGDKPAGRVGFKWTWTARPDGEPQWIGVASQYEARAFCGVCLLAAAEVEHRKGRRLGEVWRLEVCRKIGGDRMLDLMSLPCLDSVMKEADVWLNDPRRFAEASRGVPCSAGQLEGRVARLEALVNGLAALTVRPPTADEVKAVRAVARESEETSPFKDYKLPK